MNPTIEHASMWPNLQDHNRQENGRSIFCRPNIIGSKITNFSLDAIWFIAINNPRKPWTTNLWMVIICHRWPPTFEWVKVAEFQLSPYTTSHFLFPLEQPLTNPNDKYQRNTKGSTTIPSFLPKLIHSPVRIHSPFKIQKQPSKNDSISYKKSSSALGKKDFVTPTPRKRMNK